MIISPDAATAPRGVLGVVQSAKFPNPVKDFSHKRTDAAVWFGLSPPLAAGERKTFSLGAFANRIALVWCPLHPMVALQGFWILEAAVDTAMACEIHNNLPSASGFEVWKTKPLHPSREAQFRRSAARDMLKKLNAFAGFGDSVKFCHESGLVHRGIQCRRKLVFRRKKYYQKLRPCGSGAGPCDGTLLFLEDTQHSNY